MKRLMMRTMVNGSCVDSFFAEGTFEEEAIDEAKRAWMQISEEDKKRSDTFLDVSIVDIPEDADDDAVMEAIENRDSVYDMDGSLISELWEQKKTSFCINGLVWGLWEKDGSWVLGNENGESYAVSSFADMDRAVYGVRG